MKIWAFLKPGSVAGKNSGRVWETVKTVKNYCTGRDTPLKRGVNEREACSPRFGNLLLAGGLLFFVAVLSPGCSKSVLPGAGEGVALSAEDPISGSVEQSAAADEDGPEEALISEGAVQQMPAHEVVVPANLKPSEGVAELIKLVDAGNEEPLLMAFVTNYTGAFKVGADELVYLSDIGTPARVLTAMLQHDHMLPAESLTVLADSASEAPAVPAEDGGQSLATGAGAPSYVDFANGEELAPADLQNQPALDGPADVEQGSIPATGFADSVPAPPVYGGTGPVSANTEPAAEPSDALMPDFYPALAPYGTWVDVAGYGQCWQPTAALVNHDWCPYADRGHWAYSDSGWYWASDYSWGWAPFHYGRWFQHASLGWCWVPGRVWASAWVCWRTRGNLCGWAPLPPGAGFGDGPHFHRVPVKPNFHFQLAADQFHFVSTEHLTDHHPLQHAIPRERVRTFFHNTVASTSFARNGGQLANHGLAAPRNVAAAHRPGGHPESQVQIARSPNIPSGAVASESRMNPTPGHIPFSGRGPAHLPGAMPPSLSPSRVALAPGSLQVADSGSGPTLHRGDAFLTHHESVPASIPLSTAMMRAHQQTALGATAERQDRTALSVPTTALNPGRSLVMIGQHRSPHALANNQVVVNQPVQIPWWMATRPNAPGHSHAPEMVPRQSADPRNPADLARAANHWQFGNGGWTSPGQTHAGGLGGEHYGSHSFVHAQSDAQPQMGGAREHHHPAQDRSMAVHHESRPAPVSAAAPTQQERSSAGASHSTSSASSSDSHSGRR